MGQPLTLDEVGVKPEDAAQVIYDLLRERDHYERALAMIAVGGGPDAEAANTALRRHRAEGIGGKGD